MADDAERKGVPLTPGDRMAYEKIPMEPAGMEPGKGRDSVRTMIDRLLSSSAGMPKIELKTEPEVGQLEKESITQAKKMIEEFLRISEGVTWRLLEKCQLCQFIARLVKRNIELLFPHGWTPASIDDLMRRFEERVEQLKRRPPVS